MSRCSGVGRKGPQEEPVVRNPAADVDTGWGGPWRTGEGTGDGKGGKGKQGEVAGEAARAGASS